MEEGEGQVEVAPIEKACWFALTIDCKAKMIDLEGTV